MSGNDKPPKAAYQVWAAANNGPAWDTLNTAQQGLWAAIAQAAINANNTGGISG